MVDGVFTIILKLAVTGIVVSLHLLGVTGVSSHSGDVSALQSLFRSLGSPSGLDWSGEGPCTSNWTGVVCGNADSNGVSRVTQLGLSSYGVSGELPEDIGNLTGLGSLDFSLNPRLEGTIPRSIGQLKNIVYLNLQGCSFSGPIPPELGAMTAIETIQLQFNNLDGAIPAQLGRLKNLLYLDISSNRITGEIPVSTDATPVGLDSLRVLRHLYMSNNTISGPIPRQFGNLTNLVHLLVDTNELSGPLPFELANATSLSLLSFSGNRFNGSIPPSWGSFKNLVQFKGGNNDFTGGVPDISNFAALTTLRLENNFRLGGEIPSNLGDTSNGIVNIDLSNCSLVGAIPLSVAQTPRLQTLALANNHLNGAIPAQLGIHQNDLLVANLAYNNLSGFIPSALLSPDINLILAGNPSICSHEFNQSYPSVCQPPAFPLAHNPIPSFVSICPFLGCPRGLLPNPVLWAAYNQCACAAPLTVQMQFDSPPFLALTQTLADELVRAIGRGVGMNDTQVQFGNTSLTHNGILWVTINFFPLTLDPPVLPLAVCTKITAAFLDHSIAIGTVFGPVDMVAYELPQTALSLSRGSASVDANGVVVSDPSTGKNGPLPAGDVIVIVFGCIGIVILVSFLGALLLVIRRRGGGGGGDIRVDKGGRNKKLYGGDKGERGGLLNGVKAFAFKDLQTATRSFSEDSRIGEGGYGWVYRGLLPMGVLVAIKRARPDSKQGRAEFLNEIELLSRVHHKNLVSLVGYCCEYEEKMLVYPYMPMGTLQDHLAGRFAKRLKWHQRLEIGLGCARGLAYLHHAANPPIIHRDIKSSNILLDRDLVAKVADFGLSKLVLDGLKDSYSHVTTGVKGTLGYVDPHYYHFNELTEKSDVYSFGVVLLELITGAAVIHDGTHVITLVTACMAADPQLDGIADPTMGAKFSSDAFALLLNLALCCTKSRVTDRPMMRDVEKEMERILGIGGGKDSMSDMEEPINIVVEGGFDRRVSKCYSETFNLQDGRSIDLSDLLSPVGGVPR